MKQIEGEFAAQRLIEERAARRQKIISHIRTGILCLAMLGVAGAVYNYRAEIQEHLYKKISTKSPIAAGLESVGATGTTGTTAGKPSGTLANINAAQANASVRDALIEGNLK